MGGRAWDRSTHRRPLLRAAIAVLPVALLAACGDPALAAFPSRSSATSTRPATPGSPAFVGSRPPRSAWWVRRDQTGAQSSASAFAIKYLEITNLDLHCYNALRCPTPGPPRVAARVAAVACPGDPVNGPAAPAWVQAFGRLGTSEVGIIHVPFVNQPGQVFSLAITPPAAAAPAWTLTFLEQTARIAHPQGLAGLGGNDALPPEIRVIAFLGYQGNRHSGYFAVAQSTTPTSYLRSVFFAVNPDGTVTQLSAAAFSAGTIGPEATAKAYIPAPPYPPTAAPRGASAATPTPPPVRC
jgi:hypothetical protein